jgi:hypothetical protein
MTEERTKLMWSIVHCITNDRGLLVRISRSEPTPTSPVPKYSFQLGARAPGTPPQAYINTNLRMPFTYGQEKATAAPSQAADVAGLIVQAEVWALEDVNSQLAAVRQEQRYERDRRIKDKWSETKPGIKSLGKMDGERREKGGRQ